MHEGPTEAQEWWWWFGKRSWSALGFGDAWQFIMTVFRQENVDDYYDTGEELGRYGAGGVGCRKLKLLGGGNA